MALQIIVTPHLNPNVKSYSLGENGRKMSESVGMRVFDPPFKVWGKYWEGIGILGRTMLSRIFRELGGSMSLILLRPKELLIVKRKDADWDEIDPRVIEAIKRAFDPKAKD